MAATYNHKVVEKNGSRSGMITRHLLQQMIIPSQSTMHWLSSHTHQDRDFM